ncbi:AAA family ATPase [Solicola gregarius]|uniref:AAA family ATPase n=2 Tax=Solicola gregarius TaxID=2908642 RepID=A0AA46YM97_9ACTN|nr:UvrD-helicase domain-containing protein [Solicola gregarius]UYM07845.1 AAA family ATPase [Solicola gregarius]
MRPAASQQQSQDEIAHEQAYVDGVYARLDEASKVARSLVAEGHARASIGHEGALVERDAMVYQASKRLAALDAAHDGLVFGRLDRIDGEARYIGRIGVRDAEREVMLVDWRAPAAAVFYQATAQEPSGVVRRRVLRSRGELVVGVEDDLLDADNAPDDMVVVGEGALLASLSRARDATMHSVVATIQKEQDEAIRSPSRGATTIGGGPGTGKTVVALHRAAYLLYTDRRRFESGGVLVVGPSGIFMNYIDRVLPSLGETSVTLRSLGEVVDGVKAARHDVGAVAAVKGSDRMQRVLARAVRADAPDAPDEFRYFYRDDVLRLERRDLSGLRRQLLGGGQRRNRAYPKVKGQLIDALWRQVTGPRALEDGKEEFADELQTSDQMIEFVDAWWPVLDAIDVWRWLRDPERLARFADGLLSGDEQRLLLASWAEADDVAVEDVPLIDELRYLLGEVPAEYSDDEADVPKQLMSFERAEREDARTRSEQLRATQSIEDDGYAHVLVDEAQDLSPMQWRMLGRRGKYSSWTIVGDAAQSSWPLPDEAARARAAALDGKPEHTFRLSTNYRNSAEIYDFAADVARLAVPDPDLPDAVRRTGVRPRHEVVESGRLLDSVRDAVADIAAQVEGTVAVVTASARRDRLANDLAETLGAYGRRVSVLDGLDTKGLEFDGVVVVEPDQITEESEAGWRTLYVVLTRATQLLTSVGTSRDWLDRIEQ